MIDCEKCDTNKSHNIFAEFIWQTAWNVVSKLNAPLKIPQIFSISKHTDAIVGGNALSEVVNFRQIFTTMKLSALSCTNMSVSRATTK